MTTARPRRASPAQFTCLPTASAPSVHDRSAHHGARRAPLRHRSMNGYGHANASRRRFRNATTRSASSAEPHRLSRICNKTHARARCQPRSAGRRAVKRRQQRTARLSAWPAAPTHLEQAFRVAREAGHVRQARLKRAQQEPQEPLVRRLLQKMHQRGQQDLGQRRNRVPFFGRTRQPGARRAARASRSAIVAQIRPSISSPAGAQVRTGRNWRGMGGGTTQCARTFCWWARGRVGDQTRPRGRGGLRA